MARYDYAAPLEGTERIVDRPDGTTLRTISLGEGTRTVVLAHGYGASSQGWNELAPGLADRGLRVVAFDQRGHGGSTIGADGISSATMASDYGAVLEAYEVEHGTLVGHSMGGFLALAFLLDDESGASDRIGGLLLMATFAGAVNRKNAQNRLQIPMIKSGFMLRLLGVRPIAQGFAKTIIGDGFEPEMADAFVSEFLDQDHAKLVPILEAMVGESRYDRLGELDLPCTVVVGSKDKTTPPFHTADLHAGIAGSKLITIPGMGHLLNWEAPDELVDAIVELSARTDA